MPELRTITEDDDGIRLDRWFRRHYPALTHARLEKLLRKGEVRVDGKRAKSADRILAGQSLRLPPQVIHDKVEERPKPVPVQTSRKLEDTILYMDKHLFVLNKPSGLATQGGSGLKEHVDGMLDQLSFEKTVRPKLVHRLDRDTSGVLLVARTSLVVSLYENQSTMSCWHDDHGAFIRLLEAHRVAPAVSLMRKHLSDVEESLNFDRHARDPLDLRSVYAPNPRG